VAGERIQPDSQIIFSLPPDADVDHNCRVLYEDRSFSVTAVRGPYSAEIDRRVLAKELE
jgi:hypothetical protein